METEENGKLYLTFSQQNHFVTQKPERDDKTIHLNNRTVNWLSAKIKFKTNTSDAE